jgi:hypothetical protein
MGEGVRWACNLDRKTINSGTCANAQPAAISQLGQECSTGMADQVLPVGCYFGATD